MAEARIRLVRGGLATVKADVGDAELLHMFVAGHPHALRTSWLRFAPLVHRLLKYALGPELDVTELAQLVFVQLFRRAAKLREPSALRSLVIALTTDTVRTELRRRRMRRWLSFDHVASPRAASVPPDPASREAMRRLYVLLDRFKAEDRVAFVYHFLEGLSLEDVAGALQLSLPATQRRLARVWYRAVVFIERDVALLDYLSRCEGWGATA
jgi:RNA polymerase sigma-70 factor (ECF subfamily)